MDCGQPVNPDCGWGQTYTTQLLETSTAAGPVQHLIIRRHDNGEIIANWTTIQQIKDDILGPDTLAVEVYPPEARTIDEANCRHLWTLTRPLPFGLHPADKT